MLMQVELADGSNMQFTVYITASTFIHSLNIFDFVSFHGTHDILQVHPCYLRLVKITQGIF